MKKTGKIFMQETKYQNLSESDQRKGLSQPKLTVPFEGDKIPLPKYDTLTFKTLDLNQAIMNRKTVRKYTEEALTKEELSYLLFSMQGIKESHPQATKRVVPSAGARHPFEVYVLINKVKDINQGLYRYLAEEESLGVIEENKTIANTIQAACFDQVMISNSAVTFILVADIYRMTYRYVERGYRYIHLDAGHIMQNLYLASEQINAGTCAIAAFNDDALNNALALDGENHLSIYVGTTGKTEKKTNF